MDMLQNELLEWLKNNDELDDNVKNYSINWVAEGLKERSITRDVSWGVPAPFPGAEGKTIYVWFDALLGYISAVKEHFEKIGRSDEFEKWWKDKNTKTIYFIGKDNIPFHAIIFPSMLIASREGYPLPWKISATEYLLFQEEKFSKSRGIGVWADEALEILPADYWRFALIRMRPEAKDTNFSWSEFYRIINSELNDDIGNLVHRVLTFTYKNFNGSVPNQSKLSEEDIKLLNDMERFYNEAIAAYSNAKLKLASDKILEMARRGNQYLNSQAPWDEIKESRERAGTIIYNMLNYVNVLMTLLWPITPSSSEAFYSILNINGPKEGGLRRIIQEKLESGKSIRQPQPIFKKLPPDFLEKIDSIISNARDKVAQKRPKF
jgi:methionyl-tRNA synthetase